ncbi:MAG: hypothetical protein PVG07_00045 [Acidobacteriota bacterium]|jgi:hypothetical protein
MNHFKFNSLIKNIPSIEVCLDWDGLEGSKEVQDEEVEAGKFLIFASFSCFETGTYDAGDYLTPPCFSSDGLTVDNIEALVFDKEGEEIHLTNKQETILFREIETNITSV